MSKATGQVGGSRAAPFGCEEKEGVCGDDRSAVVDAQDGAPSPQATIWRDIERDPPPPLRLIMVAWFSAEDGDYDDGPEMAQFASATSYFGSTSNLRRKGEGMQWPTHWAERPAPPPIVAVRDGGAPTPSTGALSSSPHSSQNTPSQPAKAEGRPTHD